MEEKANSNSAVELIIFIKTPARWSGSHVAARNFWSAAGTFIRENKWEQLGKSLGTEPAAPAGRLPTSRYVAETHQQRHGRVINVRLRQLALGGYDLYQKAKGAEALADLIAVDFDPR
jgi:hypothetical protein